MASVHIVFRPHETDAEKERIVYNIANMRRSTSVVTDITVPRSSRSSSNLPVISMMSKVTRKIVQSDIERITTIIAQLETRHGYYNISDIKNEFENYLSDYTLKKYTQILIRSLKRRGKLRTAETYQTTLNSFMRYRSGEDIHLRLITAEEIEDYEAYLNDKGLVANTISFYMRILRAIYNRAVDEQIIDQTYPFKHVYTGVDATLKRALPLNMIKEIKNLNLSDHPSLAYARDIFLLSFYLRGMALIDMAYLRKSDLHGDMICYRRRKTGQLLRVQWTLEMEKIARQYGTEDNKFLLPILTNSQGNIRTAYRNIGYNINRNLKIIAKMIGSPAPLTLYCARHSWASVAKTEGVPLGIISEGMGHRSESTTRIYLASLDTSAVDRANNAIIKLLD